MYYYLVIHKPVGSHPVGWLFMGFLNERESGLSEFGCDYIAFWAEVMYNEVVLRCAGIYNLHNETCQIRSFAIA